MELNNPKMCPITQEAELYTAAQYHKALAKDTSLLPDAYISYTKIAAIGDMRAFVSNKEPHDDVVVVIPRDCEISYLSFILNSIPCTTTLLNGKPYTSHKTSISSRRLSSLTLPIVDYEMQKIYGMADTLRHQAYRLLQDAKDEDAYKYLFTIFSDLVHSLSLELYLRPQLQDKGEELLKAWIDLATEYTKTNEFSTIVESLSNPDGIMRNQIIKFHITLSNFTSNK